MPGSDPCLVMATDDPGADQALTPPPQNGPNLDKLPCQCPSPSPNTIPLKRAQAELGDSVGQLCSITRGLMDRHLASLAWQCCTAGSVGPRALLASTRAQQGRGCQAVTATPCQSPGAIPLPQGLQSPRNCNPGLEHASNLVTKPQGLEVVAPGGWAC